MSPFLRRKVMRYVPFFWMMCVPFFGVPQGVSLLNFIRDRPHWLIGLNEIGNRPVLFRQLTIYVAVFLTAQRTEAGAATEGGSVRTERLANGGRRLTNCTLLYFFWATFCKQKTGFAGFRYRFSRFPRFVSLRSVQWPLRAPPIPVAGLDEKFALQWTIC